MESTSILVAARAIKSDSISPDYTEGILINTVEQLRDVRCVEAPYVIQGAKDLIDHGGVGIIEYGIVDRSLFRPIVAIVDIRIFRKPRRNSYSHVL